MSRIAHTHDVSLRPVRGLCSATFKGLLLGATSLAIVTVAGTAVAQEDAESAASMEASDTGTAELDAERLRRLGIVTVTARRREESLKDARRVFRQ